MADSFREVSNRSWGSRLGGAIRGIGVGLLLLVAGSVLLFWNEGRAVHRAKTLAEGASTVIHVQATAIEARNDGKLVHVDGRAETADTVSDPDFGVRAPAIVLERNVEMYQWVEESRSETKKKLGGGTETVKTYSYKRQWRSDPVDSSQFEHPEGHANPPMPLRSGSWRAGRVTLGAFELDPVFVAQIHGSEPLIPPEEAVRRASASFPRPAAVVSDRIVIGEDPSAPKVGDLSIRWAVTPPQDLSIVGRQAGSRIEPFEAKHGRIALLESGHVPAGQMFASARASNKAATWILRLTGFMLLFFGFHMLFGLAKVAADFIPFLGKLAGVGLGVVSFLLTGLLWTLIVAIAWLAYRPILGVSLLVAAVILGVLLFRKLRSDRPPAVPPPPPPVPQE